MVEEAAVDVVVAVVTVEAMAAEVKHNREQTAELSIHPFFIQADPSATTAAVMATLPVSVITAEVVVAAVDAEVEDAIAMTVVAAAVVVATSVSEQNN
jgi:hypothetical protein